MKKYTLKQKYQSNTLGQTHFVKQHPGRALASLAHRQVEAHRQPYALPEVRAVHGKDRAQLAGLHRV